MLIVHSLSLAVSTHIGYERIQWGLNGGTPEDADFEQLILLI
jgi:hypothetical protein